MKKITLGLLVLLPLFGISQNTCATASLITAGTHVVTAVDGTQLPVPSCADDDAGVAAAEWYKFTATVNGIATISSNVPASAGGDTRLHAYSGLCGGLTCLGFSDDIGGTNYLSEIAIVVTAGTTYYFAWDDYWEADGFTFTLTESAVSCDFSVPNTENFASASEFLICYDTEDVDGNELSWIQQSLDLDGDGTPEYFATNGSYATVKNDWLFSPSYALTAGETYQISYRYNGANNATNLANETLEVLMTNAPSSTATFQEQIGLHANITQVGVLASLHITATEQTTSFTPTTSGDYNLAFHAMTPAATVGSNGFLLLFEYDIQVSLSTSDFAANKTVFYPNPVKNELNIVQQNTIDTVEIYNLLGQRVFSQNYAASNVTVNTEMLTSGTYMVKVSSEGGSNMSKIVKQ